MLELRELKEIERGDEAVYLRFSHLPIARTQTFADGELNVDLDHYNEVVGIEILSLGPIETKALAEVVAEHRLSLDLLAHASKKT
jgi:uncharacterized protein YuzE